MWFKNKRKVEELEYRIAKITDFNKKMIRVGAFNGCIGKYVRTVDNTSRFSGGGEIVYIDLPSRIYRIVMVNEPGSLALQDCNGKIRDFSIDKILRLASDDEISDFKKQELKKSKRQINKGQIRGDTIGHNDR
ncbi:hypothetical protein HOS79_gp123 [Lactobacillus phage Nyseid]|uniref:Uncharacterized protein n=1 Tax=Lactobacillus phage Nyseid TaxID=2079432 RepID=A0A2K9VCC9_9CAUD|nr:hypothetical protein HOS79_gp123 [Lactobacillus phage Nyseid]AUV59846.1 hypothetical protein [Lactobacillus phage Nyseid]